MYKSLKGKPMKNFKTAVISGAFVLSGLVLAVSCSDRDLDHNDFRGKALKERTIDELMQAKFNLENGFAFRSHTMRVNGVPETRNEIYVTELNYGDIENTTAIVPDSFPDYQNFLKLITHELQIREDTLVSKKELQVLKEYYKNLDLHKDTIAKNNQIIGRLRDEKNARQTYNNNVATQLKRSGRG